MGIVCAVIAAVVVVVAVVVVIVAIAAVRQQPMFVVSAYKQRMQLGNTYENREYVCDNAEEQNKNIENSLYISAVLSANVASLR